ncbi:unnamed protein product [Ambrosiozyma monospora]|uniref:Unnamed protein product n=1 Tax=Ambrosiozyma monospora TaxID=43982 RepID=A0ACB5SWK5_AMBMO|nr:unnamed protein product [Ambrosiozyma monospora]
MTNYREYQRIIKFSTNTTTNTNTSAQRRLNNQRSNQLVTPPSSSSESSPTLAPTSLHQIQPIPLSLNTTTTPSHPGHSHSHDSSCTHISTTSNTTSNSTTPPTVPKKKKKKITRTKTGCFCCRQRKKKCDEMKPACSGCIRNNLTCVYPTPDQIKKPKTGNTKGSTEVTRKKRMLALAKSLKEHDAQLQKQHGHEHEHGHDCCSSSSVSPSSSPVPGSPKSTSSSFVSPLSSPSLSPFSYSSMRTTFTNSMTSSNMKDTSKENDDIPRLTVSHLNSPPLLLSASKSHHHGTISIKSLLN